MTEDDTRQNGDDVDDGDVGEDGGDVGDGNVGEDGDDVEGPSRRLPAGTAGAIVAGLILGTYATWITADLIVQWVMFPVVFAMASYLCYRKDGRHAQWVFVGYGLAVLVAVTPVFLVLPDALLADAYGIGAIPLVFMYANFLLLLGFAILGGTIAYITYRFDGGTGILARVQIRRHSLMDRFANFLR